MNRNALPKSRRGWLTLMLIVASVRVFAGVPELEFGEHAASAHSADFSLVAEHSYDVDHDGDSPGTHLHCHNCCTHAPMAVSTTPLVIPTQAQIVASDFSIPVSTAPTFTHFRPPRA